MLPYIVQYCIFKKLHHSIMQLQSFHWLSGPGISTIIKNWIIE